MERLLVVNGLEPDWARGIIRTFYRLGFELGLKRAGVETLLLDLKWKSGETADDKLARVKSIISSESWESLLGISAGAVMATHMLLERRVKKVISVAGPINVWDDENWPVFENFGIENPVFLKTARRLTALNVPGEQARNILIFASRGDEVVPWRCSQLPGSELVELPTMSHYGVIARVLFKESNSIAGWLNK